MEHKGNPAYENNFRFGCCIGVPTGVEVPTTPRVNKERRAMTLMARELGMTRKQYRKYLKKGGE